MATRLYFGDDIDFAPSPAFVPTAQGTWQNDFNLAHHLCPTGHPSLTVHGFITRNVNTAAVAQTYLHAIGVTPPMQGSYDWTSNTTTWLAKCQEVSTAQDAFQMFYWGILSNDGSIVRCISALEKGATEFPTTLASRTRTDASGGAGVAYVSVPGDRFFIEVGWDKDGTTSGNIGIQYAYSTSSGDLAGDGDTGVQNGFVELSNNVVFDNEGTSYGGVNLRMMMGVGT